MRSFAGSMCLCLPLSLGDGDIAISCFLGRKVERVYCVLMTFAYTDMAEGPAVGIRGQGTGL